MSVLVSREDRLWRQVRTRTCSHVHLPTCEFCAHRHPSHPSDEQHGDEPGRLNRIYEMRRLCSGLFSCFSILTLHVTCRWKFPAGRRGLWLLAGTGHCGTGSCVTGKGTVAQSSLSKHGLWTYLTSKAFYNILSNKLNAVF